MDKNPDQLEEILQELAAIIAESAAGIDNPKYPPDIARVIMLMDLVKEITETVRQRGLNIREAKFVINFVKAAMDFWYPTVRGSRERK